MLDSTLHHFHHTTKRRKIFWRTGAPKKDERLNTTQMFRANRPFAARSGNCPTHKKGDSCPECPCGKNKQFTVLSFIFIIAHSLQEGFSTRWLSYISEPSVPENKFSLSNNSQGLKAS